MGELQLVPEALDRAQDLLDRYDPATRTWDLAREGALWDALALGRSAGEVTPAPLVAVVDTAFDVALPALGEHELVWPNGAGVSTTHGTLAALLVLETAPDARLLLYPTAVDGALDEDLVAAAIADAAGRGAQVINLSMSIRRPIGEWLEDDALLEALVADYRADTAAGRPTLEIGDSALDLEFAKIDTLARDLRSWIHPPRTVIGEAVVRHTSPTTTFFAAAGNQNGVLALPAVLDEVVAVGFIRERRWVEDGVELRAARAPSYAQSGFMDIALVQLEHVVGSSFATPIVAGFCARYCSDAEVQDFVRVEHLSRTAEDLRAIVVDTDWHDLRQGRVLRLFEEALAVAPHGHHGRRTGPCVPCAFFVLPSYVRFGLFELGWGRARHAVELFATARDLAPNSVEAAADLGVALQARARQERADGDLDGSRRSLLEAQPHLSFAVRRRPDHAPYRLHLEQVRQALA